MKFFTVLLFFIVAQSLILTQDNLVSELDHQHCMGLVDCQSSDIGEDDSRSIVEYSQEVEEVPSSAETASDTENMSGESVVFLDQQDEISLNSLSLRHSVRFADSSDLYRFNFPFLLLRPPC